MAKIVASGALFCSVNTKRFLFLHRSKSKSGTWGIVGGKSEQGESPWEALKREINEEIGTTPEIIKTMPLGSYASKDGEFEFHTYVCLVRDEFIPTLNCEHSGYAWTSIDDIPNPIHPGVRNGLRNKENKAKLEVIMELADIL